MGDEATERGIDALPDKMGGSFIDDERAPSMDIQNHDGDPVREAINRAEYFDHIAVGEVDGYAVMVTARVTDSTQTGGFHPKMTIQVDGEWRHDEGVYLGGSKMRKSFDTVWEMDREWGQLCREHDLIIIPPAWNPDD